MRSTSRILAAAAGALVLLSTLTAPASSDPRFVPDHDDIVGVGFDTTDYVVQELAGAFNGQQVGGSKRMATFGPLGSRTIKLRQGTDPTYRPLGSNDGLAKLRYNPDVSFAGSSRGPSATGDEGTTFYPFARDRLGYVYAKPRSNVSLSLTATNLNAIYTCQKTNWSQFGQPAGHIQAKVPTPESGTRLFFLQSIYMTEAQLQDAIAQPDSVCSVTETRDNDPEPVIGQPNALAPFSFARYHILSAAVQTQVGLAANAPFNVSRYVYNVIRTSDGAALAKYFNDSSWICTSAKASEVMTSQGFSTLPADQCGVPIIV